MKNIPDWNFFRRLNIKGAALDGRLAVEPDPMDHEQFIAVEEEGLRLFRLQPQRESSRLCNYFGLSHCGL